jgi:hypothetical protein
MASSLDSLKSFARERGKDGAKAQIMLQDGTQASATREHDPISSSHLIMRGLAPRIHALLPGVG